MSLALRTYEKICNRNFFRLSENRRQAFDLYRTDLKRCLENTEEEYSFFSELGLALDNDYEITSHDEAIKREFEDFFIKNAYEFKLLLIKTQRLSNKRNIINIFVKYLPQISRIPLEFVDIYIILFDLLTKRNELEDIVEEWPLTGKKTGSGIIKLAIRAFFRWKAGYIPRHCLPEDKWQSFIEGLKGDEKRPYEGITRLEAEFYSFIVDPDYLLFLSILTNPVIWALKGFKGRGDAVYRDRIIRGSGQVLRRKDMGIETPGEREDKGTRLALLVNDNKERLYERLKQRAQALSLGRETPDEFFNYLKANVGLNP